MDEGTVERVAREIARQDGVTDERWWQMDARPPDARPWEGLRATYADRARRILRLL